MRIKFRFLCVDIPQGVGDGEMNIEDGTTVRQALLARADEMSLDIARDKLLRSMFLIGKKPAQLDTVLHDGDELTIMRTLEGG